MLTIKAHCSVFWGDGHHFNCWIRLCMATLMLLLPPGIPVAVQAQVLPAFGATRAGTTGMQFLKIGPDARSAGLSGNFVALVNDVSAVYWNPTGLS